MRPTHNAPGDEDAGKWTLLWKEVEKVCEGNITTHPLLKILSLMDWLEIITQRGGGVGGEEDFDNWLLRNDTLNFLCTPPPPFMYFYLMVSRQMSLSYNVCPCMLHRSWGGGGGLPFLTTPLEKITWRRIGRKSERFYYTICHVLLSCESSTTCRFSSKEKPGTNGNNSKFIVIAQLTLDSDTRPLNQFEAVLTNVVME